MIRNTLRNIAITMEVIAMILLALGASKAADGNIGALGVAVLVIALALHLLASALFWA